MKVKKAVSGGGPVLAGLRFRRACLAKVVKLHMEGFLTLPNAAIKKVSLCEYVLTIYSSSTGAGSRSDGS